VPTGTRAVEIDTLAGIMRARFRSGMWIAAVPILDRLVKFSVRFLSADQCVVGECEGEDFLLPPHGHR
jgi:hypothetical protein